MDLTAPFAARNLVVSVEEIVPAGDAANGNAAVLSFRITSSARSSSARSGRTRPRAFPTTQRTTARWQRRSSASRSSSRSDDGAASPARRGGGGRRARACLAPPLPSLGSLGAERGRGDGCLPRARVRRREHLLGRCGIAARDDVVPARPSHPCTRTDVDHDERRLRRRRATADAARPRRGARLQDRHRICDRRRHLSPLLPERQDQPRGDRNRPGRSVRDDEHDRGAQPLRADDPAAGPGRDGGCGEHASALPPLRDPPLATRARRAASTLRVRARAFSPTRNALLQGCGPGSSRSSRTSASSSWITRAASCNSSRSIPASSSPHVERETGFEVVQSPSLERTAPPSSTELELIATEIDPLGIRHLEFMPARERGAFLAEIIAAEERLVGELAPALEPV